MPVNERMYAHPKLLSLPTPGPCKAYHHDCTEYRPIPGGGPVDNPVSYWGKVVHIGDYQVNHGQEERVPPREGRAPPGACSCMQCTDQPCLRTAIVWVPVAQGPPFCTVPPGQLARLLVLVRIAPHWQSHGMHGVLEQADRA